MNICFILPLHALKYTCPLPQSVLHIATYGPFTMTVQSQPPASISQFKSGDMPSVKKADYCLTTTSFATMEHTNTACT